MIFLEKSGKPAVAIVAKSFESVAAATAAAAGMPDFRYAVVPEVLTGIGPERIVGHVGQAFGVIESALTTEAAPRGVEHPTASDRLVFEGEDRYDAFERMNRHLLEADCGDGFPLIPPTPGKVNAVLTGSRRDRQEVVAVLPPAMRAATVEKIAVNAVMAGCEPEHLPILIAACRALPGFGSLARTMLMSTGPHAPLLVINGPIARRIGINAGCCALGPGKQSRHNIAIGRAFRLIIMNIAGAIPTRTDMDTIGTARKFSLCCAENEAQTPWAPYHVDLGYSPDVSAVTLFETRDEVDVDDLTNYEPEGVLDSFAAACSFIPAHYTATSFTTGKPTDRFVLFMSPEHAAICGKAGWSKQSVKEYIHQHARINARLAANWGRLTPARVRPEWRWLLQRSAAELERLMLTVQESAHSYDIVVVGGAAGKSMVFSTMCGGPSTVVVDDELR